MRRRSPSKRSSRRVRSFGSPAFNSALGFLTYFLTRTLAHSHACTHARLPLWMDGFFRGLGRRGRGETRHAEEGREVERAGASSADDELKEGRIDGSEGGQMQIERNLERRCRRLPSGHLLPSSPSSSPSSSLLLSSLHCTDLSNLSLVSSVPSQCR